MPQHPPIVLLIVAYDARRNIPHLVLMPLKMSHADFDGTNNTPLELIYFAVYNL